MKEEESSKRRQGMGQWSQPCHGWLQGWVSLGLQYMESSFSWVGSPRVAVHGIFFFFCRVTSFIILKVLSLIGVAQQWKNLSKTNKNCQLCPNCCCTATVLEQHSLWLWLWLNDSAWSIAASTQFWQDTNQCMKYHNNHSQYGQNTNQVWSITTATHSLGRTLTRYEVSQQCS